MVLEVFATWPLPGVFASSPPPAGRMTRLDVRRESRSERCAGRRRHNQLVTSAEVNRAQAIARKITAYTAKDASPCHKVVVSTGVRSSESNDSHQSVGRYGVTGANCGMFSTTSLATTTTSTAAIAPIACSVNVEIARPIAPSAAIAAHTYSVTHSTCTRPSASDTVVPDSRVTGPAPNSATPVSSATTETTKVAATAHTTIVAYFTASSRVRPAGTASR